MLYKFSKITVPRRKIFQKIISGFCQISLVPVGETEGNNLIVPALVFGIQESFLNTKQSTC